MKQLKKPKKLFPFMSNFQTYYQFKQNFQNVDQQTLGKWLIHGTKRRRDNHLQPMLKWFQRFGYCRILQGIWTVHMVGLN